MDPNRVTLQAENRKPTIIILKMLHDLEVSSLWVTTHELKSRWFNEREGLFINHQFPNSSHLQ